MVYQYVKGLCIWKPLDAPEQENSEIVISSWTPNIKDVKVEYLGEAHNSRKKKENGKYKFEDR